MILMHKNWFIDVDFCSANMFLRSSKEVQFELIISDSFSTNVRQVSKQTEDLNNYEIKNFTTWDSSLIQFLEILNLQHHTHTSTLTHTTTITTHCSPTIVWSEEGKMYAVLIYLVHIEKQFPGDKRLKKKQFQKI